MSPADEAAKARADAIRARALAGESFEKLAADLSESPSRANAGLIGPINLDDLSADLRKIIEAMKVGDVAEPLRTARGYQILKLESSTPKQVTPFEQAREQIANSVLTDKRKREFLKYLEKLRSQAIIEWKNPDVKKAYDEGLKQQAADAVATVPLTMDSDAQWYAVWTRSRHEQVVRDQLERKEIAAFLPTITRWSRWKDRKKKIDWPLFPGYCFARFDPEDAWRS